MTRLGTITFALVGTLIGFGWGLLAVGSAGTAGFVALGTGTLMGAISYSWELKDLP